MFSSKSFIVLCFTFKSVCHFELIFLYHVRFRGRLTSWTHLELEAQEGDEMQRLGGQEGAQGVSRVLGCVLCCEMNVSEKTIYDSATVC